jgi:hypothetical protein
MDLLLNGILGSWLFLLPLYFLVTMRQAVSFTMHSLHDALPCHRPKSNGVNESWTKTVSQSKPFLLINSLSQVFCHGDRKLAITIGFSFKNSNTWDFLSFKRGSLIHLHLM